MASPEDFQAAGLYDPVADAKTGRLDLLRWLDDQGFTIDEMVVGLETGALGALAGDRRLVGGPRLSNADAERLAGLTAGQLAGFAAAFGFSSPDPSSPDELGLNESEALALALFSSVAGMFSEAEALGFVRVVGSSIGRIAEAAVSLFLADVEGPSLAAAGSEVDLAKNVLGAVELLDDFIPMLDPVLRRHVLQAVERSRLAIIDERERLQYRYAVGFVDLVGFTPLSQDMSPSELGVFIREFEARAHDAVSAAGARLVKLIGDEVMFVAPDPDSACAVAEALMSDVVTADGGSVVPRGGVAYGPVLVRGGDYYGSVVNVASRLVDEAKPGELLVTAPFADAVTCLTFESAGERLLKGFVEPVAVASLIFDTD